MHKHNLVALHNEIEGIRAMQEAQQKEFDVLLGMLKQNSDYKKKTVDDLFLQALEAIYISSPERKMVFTFYPNHKYITVALTDYKFNTKSHHGSLSDMSEIEIAFKKGIMLIDGVREVSFRGNEIRFETLEGFKTNEIVDRVYACINFLYYTLIKPVFCDVYVTKNAYIPQGIRIPMKHF